MLFTCGTMGGRDSSGLGRGSATRLRRTLLTACCSSTLSGSTWCCIRLATVAGLGGASRTWWGGERAWSSGLGRAVERARVPPPRAVQRVELSVDATTTWTAACVKRAVDLEFWLDQWNCVGEHSRTENMSFRVLNTFNPFPALVIK